MHTRESRYDLHPQVLMNDAKVYWDGCASTISVAAARESGEGGHSGNESRDDSPVYWWPAWQFAGDLCLRRYDCHKRNLSAGVPQQVSLQGVQTRKRVCNDLAFVVRIRVLDKVLDSREHCGFRFMDSKAKFYRIVFNERVRVKGVPFGLILMAPQVLNVRCHNLPKARKSDYTIYPV
jgi:hypothetical protein